MSVLRIILVLILFLFIVGRHHSAAAQEKPKPVVEIQTKEKNFKFIKEFGYTLSRNNNVVIGTETRAKLDPLRDSINNLNATLGLYQRFPNRGEIYGLYSIDLINHDTVDFLSARQHSLLVFGERYFGLSTSLRVRGNLKFFDFYNLNELSFLQNSLEISLDKITSLGIIYELDAMVGNRSFPNGISNITGYALVNSRQVQLSTRVKFWQTAWLRWGLRYSLFLEQYDGTESTYLNTLSGLTSDEGRRDLIHSLQPEVTLVLLKGCALTLGYQHQRNASNSDYYKFRGNTMFAQSTIRFNDENLLFVQASYGIYDYYHRQFDERYINTKKDFRTSFNLNYQYRLLDFMFWEARYAHFNNDSNDSIDFDPLTSKSYSTFSQHVFNVGLRFDLTDLDIF